MSWIKLLLFFSVYLHPFYSQFLSLHISKIGILLPINFSYYLQKIEQSHKFFILLVQPDINGEISGHILSSSQKSF
jgi:hypothetical protein